MGTLVSALFSFGANADVSPLGCGSPLYSISMTFSKRLILLLILCWPWTPPDSLVSSCGCIIMRFACLIELYADSPDIAFQPYSLSLSHVQPSRAILYIFCNLIPHFLPGGDFPPSVVILHMCPCIEHRYVPLLGTSLLVPWHSSPPRFVLESTFILFQYFQNI